MLGEMKIKINKITIFAAILCVFIALLVSYDFLSNKAEEEAKYWKGIKIVESRVWKGRTVHKLDDGSVVFADEMENVWVQAQAEIWVVPKEPKNKQTYAEQSDASVFREAGFRDWKHYERTYDYCMRLVYASGQNCTNWDERRDALRKLMGSQKWICNGCEKIAWGSSEPSYDELVNQVDKLQNRIYELENR